MFARALLAMLLLASPAAAHERVSVPGPEGVSLDTLLFRPAGPGPHPAVILLHGCGGRDDRQGRMMPRDAAWARRLADAGYLVAVPDSFGSRGLGQQCTVRARTARAWAERREDARSVRDFLSALAEVRAGAIVLMGFSNGGTTVLHAADLPGFAAFVSFYPGCRPFLARPGWAPAAPLLLLIGAADDWTPPGPCEDLAAAHPSISFRAYPGAFHGFDAPDTPVRVREGLAFTASGTGRAHVGTEPAARADALSRVPAFLAAVLGAQSTSVKP